MAQDKKVNRGDDFHPGRGIGEASWRRALPRKTWRFLADGYQLSFPVGRT
jgi:hypothetical protein